MALRIYDIAIDGLRDVEQRDIDNYGSLNRAYGKLRDLVRDNPDAEIIQQELMKEFKGE